MAKNMLCPCSVFSSADQKILSEDTNKCLRLSSLLTLHKLYTQLFIFWFQRFRSAGKIDEDDALVHLELFPHQQSHCNFEILIKIQKVIKYEKRQRTGVSKSCFISAVKCFAAKI